MLLCYKCVTFTFIVGIVDVIDFFEKHNALLSQGVKVIYRTRELEEKQAKR